MRHIKELHYFFNGVISTKNFNPNLLKLDKKSYENIDIYYIGYITKKDVGDYESFRSVNLLYFIAGEVNGYIVEKIGKDT